MSRLAAYAAGAAIAALAWHTIPQTAVYIAQINNGTHWTQAAPPVVPCTTDLDCMDKNPHLGAF